LNISGLRSLELRAQAAFDVIRKENLFGNAMFFLLTDSKKIIILLNAALFPSLQIHHLIRMIPVNIKEMMRWQIL